MLRVVFRLLMASAVVGGVALTPACSGPSKNVKHGKKGKKGKKDDSRALVSEARDDAKNGEYDAADKAYAEAYETSKDFDVLEERIDFLIHSGRATKAVEASKAYCDSNVTDGKGYALYAEALLTSNRGSEALEVADQLVQLNGDDPAG